MFIDQSTKHIALRSLLRQLDYIPAWPAIAVGVGVGALMGAGLALTWPIGFALLLGAAFWLAYSGEPIMVAEETRLVDIPAGSFLMGSEDHEDEQPIHEVHISAFQCMPYLLTRRLYQALMGKDPGLPEEEADERPINNVTWFDAVHFCNRLSEQEGLTPCYRFDDDDKVTWNPTADGFRLPTEAEWEYACRAKTQTRWFCGDDEKELEQYALFNVNSKDEPQPVGKQRPNPWGLYDMHGNVREWCWDWYGSYSAKLQTDPDGPHEGQYRLRRGGAFFIMAEDLRSAFRNRGRPEGRNGYIGFRCVRGARRQLDS